jgi:CRISPR/Cas system-associated exonuclease Cas4 (RecB family)
MGNPYNDLFKMIKAAEGAQTIEEQFISDLNKVIQLGKSQYIPSTTIKPSALGGCFREQWFMLNGVEQDAAKFESADNISITESGNDRHNRLQNHLQGASRYGVPIIWVDPESEVKNLQLVGINTIVKRRDGNEVLCYNSDYNLNFKCDGIIIYRGIKMILEIKTEEHFKWIQRFGPEPKHEFQAAAYSLGLGIDDVMFLYENRNYTTRKAYKITVSPEFKEIVKGRITHIMAYKHAEKIPPKEKTKCQYCKYKAACKAQGDSDGYEIGELRKIERFNKLNQQGA